MTTSIENVSNTKLIYTLPYCTETTLGHFVAKTDLPGDLVTCVKLGRNFR